MDLMNMSLDEILEKNPQLKKQLEELALKQNLDDASLKTNQKTGEENPNLVYSDDENDYHKRQPVDT